jgi:hypothetical protein
VIRSPTRTRTEKKEKKNEEKRRIKLNYLFFIGRRQRLPLSCKNFTKTTEMPYEKPENGTY